MSGNKQENDRSLTAMQRQAVLVCVICALAVLLTAGVTLTLLKRGKQPAEQVPADSAAQIEPGEDLSDYYQIDNTSSALLGETADAGEDYLSQTLFLGDSNTVRLYNNGLISLQQFCAKEGIGTQAALNEGIVTFKNDSNHYTLAQAVAMMKPRRVVITLGTNDANMPVDEFISNYTALVQAIQTAYPYTDIIVNTVPPIPVNHSTYPNMDQAKIDDFNMALLSMCEQLGVRFLNSAETLKDETGYGRADYYTSGDIHLKSNGLKALLSYLRTHAYETEDRRPDTANIPTRTIEYSSNPSSAVAAPSSEASQKTLYEARYQVEKSGGGTLTCGDDAGKTSLTYGVSDAGQQITVTAVPADGYVFVKWSDGVTSRTRTDTNFKQNVDVTAVFGSAAVHITCEGSGFFGTFYTFKASLKGKYADADTLRWYANGKEVTEAAGMTTVTFMVDSSMLNETYKVYATVSYNDSTSASNTLVVSMNGVNSDSSSGSSSGSSSSSSSSEAPSGSTSGAESASSSSSGSVSSGASSASSSSQDTAASSSSSTSSSSSSASVSSSGSASGSSSSQSTASSSSSQSAAASSSDDELTPEQRAAAEALDQFAQAVASQIGQ